MRLLDLFCGAGGAAVGYWRAGVDNRPQPNYPGRFEFVLTDALKYLAKRGREFDLIHASPPCQAYCLLNHPHRKTHHPRYIEPLRELLEEMEVPYIIENVPGAPLEQPIRLCGAMFGLRVIRHRLFETSLPIGQPPHIPHGGTVKSGDYVTVAGHGGAGSHRYRDWCDAMGIYWMSKSELKEAIPPAYTQWLGWNARLWL
jgi:DNA (cytosine-5)-methyltransferase 1